MLLGPSVPESRQVGAPGTVQDEAQEEVAVVLPHGAVSQAPLDLVVESKAETLQGIWRQRQTGRHGVPAKLADQTGMSAGHPQRTVNQPRVGSPAYATRAKNVLSGFGKLASGGISGAVDRLRSLLAMVSSSRAKSMLKWTAMGLFIIAVGWLVVNTAMHLNRLFGNKAAGTAHQVAR